jgi:effector-binding domain-containing protein
MNLNLQYNGHEIRGFNTLSISGLRGGMYFLYHSIPWMVTLSPFQRDEDCPIHSRNALSHSLFKEEGVMQQMNHEYEIVEKQVDDMLIAGIRQKGKYADCGQRFARLGRSMGWLINGKPFNLYYEMGCEEEDADYESCFPIRKEKQVEGIEVRTLPGGRCISLLHKGPYEELHRAYEAIMSYAREKGYSLQPPAREIYLKGPGMFFKGNPKKYLTEIQFMV